MSTKAVIVWLALAIVLGGVALFLLSVQPGVPATTDLSQGQGLFSFQASQVEAIRVLRPDGSQEILESTRAGGRSPKPESDTAIGLDSEWVLRLVPGVAGAAAQAPVGAPTPWPVPSAQVQSLLRILADLKSVGTPPPDAALGSGTTVEFQLSGGATCTFRLAERTLAGTCLATSTCPPPAATGAPAPRTPSTTDARALVDAKIHDLFNSPGPPGWREQAFLAGWAPQASRIRLENPRQTLALGKIDGRWSLREPAAAPADPAAIQKLLGELSRVRIVDFLDQGVGDVATGLDAPVARLVIEQDVRSIPAGSTEPRVETSRCTIVVGTAADAAATRLFASIDGSRTVLLESEALANLSMDPVAYLWPHPTRLVPADIGMLVLSRDTPSHPGTVLRRTAGKWVRVNTDGAESVLVEADLKGVEDLLTFLTGPARPAADDRPVLALEAPEGYRIAARISIRSAGNDALENLELGPSGADRYTVRTGAVYRTYPAAKLPAIIADLLKNAPAVAPAPAALPVKPVDVNK